MRQVNMTEAKTQLSSLVRAVQDGEQIVIARAGEPVAVLVSHQAEEEILPAFDDSDAQIARDFGILD